MMECLLCQRTKIYLTRTSVPNHLYRKWVVTPLHKRIPTKDNYYVKQTLFKCIFRNNNRKKNNYECSTLCLLIGWGWNSHKALGNKLIFNLTLCTRLHLSHHLLPAGTTASTLLEFTHIFPVTLALFLFGVGTASVKRCGRSKCWPAEGGGNKGLK